MMLAGEFREVHLLPRSLRKHTHSQGQTLTAPSVLILKSLMGHGGWSRFIVSWLTGENSRKTPCWVMTVTEWLKRSAEDVVLIVSFPAQGRLLLLTVSQTQLWMELLCSVTWLYVVIKGLTSMTNISCILNTQQNQQNKIKNLITTCTTNLSELKEPVWINSNQIWLPVF